jgi:isoquinoline 1-oxidoreductase alpha subunit|tara:strand:+ start:161 stop:640 length:480 start_codon:yes stop_codon:yes gene_type:complete
MYKLNVNDRMVEVDVDHDTPLLWVIREELGLTGTKFGCGLSLCGACTMLVDGVATRTCVYPVNAALGKSIKTIESLNQDGQLNTVQQAWQEFNVAQCGYCQSGQIMAATALVNQAKARNAILMDHEIDQSITNICRCGTYNRIRKAIHRAVELALTEQE